MKITSVQATPIRVPRAVATVATQGSITESEFGVVRVDTDEGLVGWGEIAMSWGRLGRSLCHDVEVELAPAIMGLDPCRLPSCVAAMSARLPLAQDGAHAARAGIEMALLDIVGKAYGLPVCQLLGGRARDAVPVAWTIPWGAPAAAGAAAATAVEQGYRAIKLKVGRRDGSDLESVKAARAAVGDGISIKVDANMAYRSAGEARAALEPLFEHGLQLVEQPLPARDLDELARLRSVIPVPLLVDESCWDLRDVGEIVRRRAADALNIYVMEIGGPFQALKAFAAAEAAGLVGLLGSQCELGLGTAACAHVGVAVSNLAFESDVVGPTRYSVDIVRNPPRIAGGLLHVPDGPGLGVEVDEDVIARFAI